jgi:hypothetical protein
MMRHAMKCDFCNKYTSIFFVQFPVHASRISYMSVRSLALKKLKKGGNN